MKPIISIIIPVYNVEKYIKKCLDSIKEQNIKENLEIICIDDGSTDKSGDICDEYAKVDKRFKVFHQNNKGIGATRNFGVNVATGKYLAWIDPDDYISSEWWNNIQDLLAKDIDMIFFDYNILKEGKLRKKIFSNGNRYVQKEEFLKEIVCDQKIGSELWYKVFKKNLMENIFFPENVNTMEDYAVLHKIVLKTKNIYYLSKCLYFYRIRSNSLVTNNNLEKMYTAYLIAKDRYTFLSEKKYIVPIYGYLLKALDVYIQYYKLNRDEKKIFRKKYMECKKDLDLNKKYMILCSRYINDFNIKTKIKFLLYKFNLMKLLINIIKIIRI